MAHVTRAELRLRRDFEELSGANRFTVNKTATRVSFPHGFSKSLQFNVDVTPSDGAWRDGTFRFEFKVPSEYPFRPPRVKCLTPTVHPNIHAVTGDVWLPMFIDWRPVLTVNTCVLALQLMFFEPYMSHPINLAAATCMQREPAAFESMVQSMATLKITKRRAEDSVDDRAPQRPAQETVVHVQETSFLRDSQLHILSNWFPETLKRDMET
jgi:ubiquitin-conjugating enzyme E2 M